MGPLYQLAAIRRLLGLSQAELGARAGLSQREISYLENGLCPTDNDRVKRIAQALGVHPSVLWSPRATICTSPSGLKVSVLDSN